MVIPINAPVDCIDGAAAHSTAVIINPDTNQVTHVVVRERRFLRTEHLVSVELIEESTVQRIQLRCTTAELAAMPPFILADFLSTLPGFASYPGDSAMMSPYATLDSDLVMIEHEDIPAGEVALHRWADVYAADGVVGWIDEFLIDPATNKLSHLVLSKGHLWGQRDIRIPVAQIDRIEAETVYLKLSKQQISALPIIVVHHHSRIV